MESMSKMTVDDGQINMGNVRRDKLRKTVRHLYARERERVGEERGGKRRVE